MSGFDFKEEGPARFLNAVQGTMAKRPVCMGCDRFVQTSLQGYGYCRQTMRGKMDYFECDQRTVEDVLAEEKLAMNQALRVVLDEGAFLPVRANPSDAGLDLMARERQVVWPGQRCCFDTGVHVAIPEGHVGLITSKSGLMRDYGVLTSGTIDAGYTGSLRVILINTGDTVLEVGRGRKIAQLVILPIITPEVRVVVGLPETARGDGGFGSSGEYVGQDGGKENEV